MSGHEPMQALLFAKPDAGSIDVALRAEPDVLVVDAPGCRMARIRARPGSAAPRLWVVIAPLDQDRAEADIAAALEGRPDAICLAGAVGRPDVEQLGAKLAIAEAEHDLPDGSTRIVALISRGASLAALPTIGAGRPRRLAALVLDVAGLRSDIGCGPDAAILALALGTFILAARSAGVPAIFLLDEAGDGDLAGRIAAVRSEGFTAILVGDPEAVPAIREAFRPETDA